MAQTHTFEMASSREYEPFIVLLLDLLQVSFQIYVPHHQYYNGETVYKFVVCRLISIKVDKLKILAVDYLDDEEIS